MLRDHGIERAFLAPTTSYNAVTAATPAQLVEFLSWRRGKEQYKRYQTREFGASGYHYSVEYTPCNELCTGPNAWPVKAAVTVGAREDTVLRSLVPAHFDNQTMTWGAEPSSWVVHTSDNEFTHRSSRTGKLLPSELASCRAKDFYDYKVRLPSV